MNMENDNTGEPRAQRDAQGRFLPGHEHLERRRMVTRQSLAQRIEYLMERYTVADVVRIYEANGGKDDSEYGRFGLFDAGIMARLMRGIALNGLNDWEAVIAKLVGADAQTVEHTGTINDAAAATLRSRLISAASDDDSGEAHSEDDAKGTEPPSS